MLSITTSPPAAWSPAPATAIAPVSAATPVAPVQATARDAQTGSGTSGGGNTANLREGSAGQRAREREGRQAERPQAAPLLPRPSPEDGQQGRQSPAVEAEQAEAEREQRIQEAQEQARQQRLQDVIANVWKASAAVVDRALGLDSEDGRAVSGATAAAEPAQPVAATGSVAVPAVQPAAAPVASALGAANDPQIEIEALKAGQDVVAYDAQGNSSLAPLETGTLLDRRV